MERGNKIIIAAVAAAAAVALIATAFIFMSGSSGETETVYTGQYAKYDVSGSYETYRLSGSVTIEVVSEKTADGITYVLTVEMTQEIRANYVLIQYVLPDAPRTITAELTVAAGDTVASAIARGGDEIGRETIRIGRTDVDATSYSVILFGMPMTVWAGDDGMICRMDISAFGAEIICTLNSTNIV
ncbi:MAG: hypothetical protein LBH69_01495 [Methanomassiliicoccaceae archaeon]|jgi:hypothetical protein|nr:hypothetical protein [Methanomassiliicoccaceae archaeon]